jgi:hypothetical protein
VAENQRRGAARKARTTPSSSPHAQQAPTILLDAVVIEEVPLPLWGRVFHEIGYPSGVPSNGLTMEAVHDYVRERQVSPEFIEVLQVIHDIGTDSGLDAMIAVAGAHQRDLGTIATHPPREAAVELWLAQRRDASLSEVFTRVQMQAEARREPRTFREFRGKTARPLLEWNPIQLRLGELVRIWCREQGFGEHVDVRGYVQGGDARVQVIHGHRVQKPVVVRDGGLGRATIEIRPVHCDIVRYDAATAWLRVSPRSASAGIVERYRRVIGEAFFGDPDFFGKDVACTLRPLQERGQRALDGGGGVAGARVTELLWQRGDDQTIWVKAPDCLVAASDMKLPITEGEFLEAKIALTLIGRRTTRRTVHVKVPNRIDYPRDVHESAIEEFLVSSGIRHVEVRTQEKDLWDLYPWRHTERQWREAYPADADELVRRGVLRRVQLSAIASPDLVGAGKPLRVTAHARHGDAFGVSDDDDVAPRQLTASDIEGFELDVSALREYWRSALELVGQVQDLGAGVVVLGERQLDSVTCAVAVLERQPTAAPASLGNLLRAGTRAPHVAVMVPVGRDSGTGIVDLPFGALTLSARDIWRRFVTSSNLAAQLPAIWSAPTDARLVVDHARKSVWIDGLAVGVLAESHPYQLIEMLAEAHGNLVSHEEIARKLSSAREDEASVVSKKAKAALKKAIEKTFREEGRSILVDEIVRGGAGGYRLGVASHVG